MNAVNRIHLKVSSCEPPSYSPNRNRRSVRVGSGRVGRVGSGRFGSGRSGPTSWISACGGYPLQGDTLRGTHPNKSFLKYGTSGKLWEPWLEYGRRPRGKKGRDPSNPSNSGNPSKPFKPPNLENKKFPKLHPPPGEGQEILMIRWFGIIYKN